MNDRRLLVWVVVGLTVMVIGLGVWWMLAKRPLEKKSSANAIRNTALPEDVKQAMAFSNLTALTPPDDRMVLYGDSLVSQEQAPLTEALSAAFHWKIEVISSEQAKTTAALTQLVPVLQHPPKVLIFDLGRYDGSSSDETAITASNLAMINRKVRQLGVIPVFIFGPSSDGSVLHADILKNSFSDPITSVNATNLLLTSKLRQSSVALNSDGMKLLGQQLVSTLRPLLQP